MAKARPWLAQLEPPPLPDGWTTGPPDFVGVGAQRSGTSWWYDSLRKHPKVSGGSPGKELHFFDWYPDGNIPADFVERYHGLFPRPPGAICGEWTPRYMSDTWSMRLLREAAPEAKILIMLRDPVERYRSAASRERWLAGTSMKSRLSVLADAAWRGYYHEQLRRVFAIYPREQVLVLQFERAVADPVEQMERTCEFLGIDSLPEPPQRLTTHRKPSHPKSELPAWFRADLAERYRDDAERLAELCPEIDLSLWKNLAAPPAEGSLIVPPSVSSNGAGAGERQAPAEIDRSVLTPEGMEAWLKESKPLFKRIHGKYRGWARRYGRTHRRHFRDTLELVAEAEREAGVRRVLDVGSVPGYLTAVLARAGFEVQAVDLDPGRVEPVYSELGVRTHRVDVEMQSIPVEDETIDLALLCQTLEHLRNEPMRALREIARALRPGGYAIVSVPNVTPYMRVRFLLGDDELFGDPLADQLKLRQVGHAADSRLYSRRQVERMLERAGLRLERVKLGGGIRVRKEDRGRIMRGLSRVAPGRMQGTQYYLAVKPQPAD